jgi:hypothetical protein
MDVKNEIRDFSIVASSRGYFQLAKAGSGFVETKIIKQARIAGVVVRGEAMRNGASGEDLGYGVKDQLLGGSVEFEVVFHGVVSSLDVTRIAPIRVEVLSRPGNRAETIRNLQEGLLAR